MTHDHPGNRNPTAGFVVVSTTMGNVLTDATEPQATRERADRARAGVRWDYGWGTVATQTTAVYEVARASLGTGPDDPRLNISAARHALRPVSLHAPPGPLLDVPQ